MRVVSLAVRKDYVEAAGCAYADLLYALRGLAEDVSSFDGFVEARFTEKPFDGLVEDLTADLAGHIPVMSLRELQWFHLVCAKALSARGMLP